MISGQGRQEAVAGQIMGVHQVWPDSPDDASHPGDRPKVAVLLREGVEIPRERVVVHRVRHAFAVQADQMDFVSLPREVIHVGCSKMGVGM